jgi:hypothetical protein
MWIPYTDTVVTVVSNPVAIASADTTPSVPSKGITATEVGKKDGKKL